jgi:hypothetical protein
LNTYYIKMMTSIRACSARRISQPSRTLFRNRARSPPKIVPMPLYGQPAGFGVASVALAITYNSDLSTECSWMPLDGAKFPLCKRCDRVDTFTEISRCGADCVTALHILIVLFLSLSRVYSTLQYTWRLQHQVPIR